ncbi:hypothetical protein QFZ21_004222 [Microbacterium sp. W4I20]|nr:hypothetical protein [Microbacterium sp. W4I20]
METVPSLLSAPSAEHDPAPASAIVAELRGALAMEDWTRAVGLVGAHWSMLLDDLREVLDDALRVIPLPAFAQDTRAAAIRDIRLHVAADEVDRMLGEAVLPDLDDLVVLDEVARSPRALSLLSVIAVRMIAFRVRGRLKRAAQLAELLERLGRIAGVHQPALISPRLPVALLQAGITRGLADDIPGALLTLRDAYERGPNARKEHVERDAAGKSAFFLALAGDMTMAATWLRRHDESPHAHGWLKPRIALTADIARALVATEELHQAEAATALARLDQPVNAEQSWGPGVTYAHARYALAWGDRHGAVENVRRDQQRYAEWLVEGTTLRPLLVMAESDLLLSLGRVHPARHVLANSADHPVTRVARARVELAAADYDAASRYAAAALSDGYSTRTRVEALAVQTATSLLREEPQASISSPDFEAAAQANGLALVTLSLPRHDPQDGGKDDEPDRREILPANAETGRAHRPTGVGPPGARPGADPAPDRRTAASVREHHEDSRQGSLPSPWSQQS